MRNLLGYRLPNIHNKRLTDPHVVIIGAGASKAACPVDKNGKKVPLLKNIIEVIDVDNLLQEYGSRAIDVCDFEEFYSDLFLVPQYQVLCKELEDKVYDYFSDLVICDEINLYDYLILSLTSKDLIICFNWDPFLLQAYRRNIDVGNLPEIVFPHGNVGVGVCYRCRVKGYYNNDCSQCYHPFEKMRLLYPIGEKDYENDGVIQNEWDVARQYLERATGLTIFGYGAPISDISAVDMMKKAFEASNIKTICPTTIVNLADVKEDQVSKWGQFYDPSMLVYCEKLQDTILWENPRVSLETLFDAILQQNPRKTLKPYQNFMNLLELQQFIRTITEFELWFPDKPDT